MSEYSKVRVEFSEKVGPGVFNTFAHEAGTDGESRLGVDLAYALDVPRPLLILAEAICEVYDRRKDKGDPPPLLRAAMDYVKRWREYDRQTAGGADPATLTWPG